MERRFVINGKLGKVQCRAEENEKVEISGLAAVYYDASNPDTEYELWTGMRERIMPGAFDRAIKENQDVRGLFNHDSNQVLARTASGTMQLKTSNRGLDYTINPPDTQVGRDVVTLLERGDIDGSSFAFKVVSETWRSEGDLEIREINDVELYDVGPVTYPAYAASTSGVRADNVAEARSSRDAWKASNEPDEPKADPARDAKNRAMAKTARLAELGLPLKTP